MPAGDDDTGPDPGTDTGRPDDTGGPLPGGGTFRFTWRAPVSGVLHIEGEFQGGTDDTPTDRQTWTPIGDGAEVTLEREVCADAFHGEGVLDVDGDGSPNGGSCTRQRDGTSRQRDGTFALTGAVRTRWFEASLPPKPSAA